MKKANPKKGPSKRKITFTLDAPQANEVFLVGDFNQWNIRKHIMKKDIGGMWEKSVFLTPGTYEYKFFVDGHWRHDPTNDQNVPNSFGTTNNIIVVKK